MNTKHVIFAFLCCLSSRGVHAETNLREKISSNGNDPNELVKSRSTERLPDYKLLDQQIDLMSLRAGSYDKTGSSQYYFKVSIKAKVLSDTKDSNPDQAKESGRDLEKQLGTFGAMTLKSLDAWESDTKNKNGQNSIRVVGDVVRETVAKSMVEWNLSESEILILIKLEMFRSTKKFGFIGDDSVVAWSTYQVVPLPKSELDNNNSLTLNLNDDKGSRAKIQIKFDKLVSS